MISALLKRREDVPFQSIEARILANRLDRMGEEVASVRAAMRLLGDGTPGDPFARATEMLGAISTSHFEAATRMRTESPQVDDPYPGSVKRRQRLILTAIMALMVLLALFWLGGDDDGRARGARINRNVAGEQEWMAQSEARFEAVEESVAQ